KVFCNNCFVVHPVSKGAGPVLARLQAEATMKHFSDPDLWMISDVLEGQSMQQLLTRAGGVDLTEALGNQETIHREKLMAIRLGSLLQHPLFSR
ncbi:MAG: hypothetical protein AAFQ94_29485, partial [Bacteroidota bacterium]